MNALKKIDNETVSILDGTIPIKNYIPIDLSISNPELEKVVLANPDTCQAYIDTVLYRENGTVAFGGYFEKRSLYKFNQSFSIPGKSARDIHLGIDFWAVAGTKVITPLNGKVHSFKNNFGIGDYGPTIILEHDLNGFHFHTLYGHLSVASLEDLFVGKKFQKGNVLATLGTPDVNVNYAPHLHFQLILDIEGKKGDYPGVCSANDSTFYSKNCPDPNLLLKFKTQ